MFCLYFLFNGFITICNLKKRLKRAAFWVHLHVMFMNNWKQTGQWLKLRERLLTIIRIIALMIIENWAWWLTRSFASSHYNHRAVIITLKASRFQNGSQICWYFGVAELINLKKMLSSKNKICFKIWSQAVQRWVNKISLLQETKLTENWYFCLQFFCFKVSATFSNFYEIFCSVEWFQRQKEFTNERENMEVDELNRYLANFYLSARNYRRLYKKTSLLSIRAALDRYLKAPKSLKNMYLFYFIPSNNHQCNHTETISRLRLLTVE